MNDLLAARLRVKPLEWEPRDGGHVARPKSGPVYSIERFHDEWDLLIDGCHTKPYRAGFRETYALEAAKTAAQADYEARILSALDRLPAPEGVGLTRYHLAWGHMMMPAADGEWVRHEDAAAALAAEKARADEAEAAVSALSGDVHDIGQKLQNATEREDRQRQRAEAAEARCDTLAGALAEADTLIEGWIEADHILCSRDPDDYGRWTAHVVRCSDRAALSTLPAPAASGEGD